MIGGNVCVRNFDQSGDYASGLAAVFASMRSHDPQISSIVPRRGLPFAAPVERLRKIKLRICLTGIDIDGALPAINGRLAVPLALRQDPEVHQRINVPWPTAKDLLVLA